MSLNILLDLIKQLVDYVKSKIEDKKKKDLINAVDETLTQKDTSKLEEALGGSSGPADPSKYDGVYTRDKIHKK